MTVINKTRYKFFLAMTAIIFFIILAFCVSILISTGLKYKAETNATLNKMIEDFNNPFDSHPLDIDRFNEIRGFTVKLNSNYQIMIIKSTGDYYGTENIIDCVSTIISASAPTGKIDNLEYMIVTTQSGTILACLDISMENALFSELVTTIIVAGSGSMLSLLIIVWWLSYWIIKPAAITFEMQKRFISEAGHELKTPLSVISASVELLQKNAGEFNNGKWLETIKLQTQKMSIMATELLTLSKLDEGVHQVKNDFNLSQIILTESLTFESVAFESGKQLTVDVESNIYYKGDADSVRQAIGILLDNAVKYSVDESEINVKLKKQASKIIFTVSNLGNLTKDEIPFLFERFYRGAEARSQTDGSGLGLAILKAFSDRNKWELSAELNQKKITFTIIL